MEASINHHNCLLHIFMILRRPKVHEGKKEERVWSGFKILKKGVSNFSLDLKHQLKLSKVIQEKSAEAIVVCDLFGKPLCLSPPFLPPF